MSDPIPDIWAPGEKRVGVVIGTGPSLTPEQVASVSHLKRFGANRSFEFDIDVVLGCNYQFWRHYWPQIGGMRCDKWTSHPENLQDNLPGLKFIEGRWEDGLSTDPSWIAYHHGSGPQIVNMAYHYGCEVILLIGWDMAYHGKVSRREYTEPRHYFGDDALSGKHFPMTGPNGEMTGLLAEMDTVAEHARQIGFEIINCTGPRSAMTCFPRMDLDEALRRYEVTAP